MTIYVRTNARDVSPWVVTALCGRVSYTSERYISCFLGDGKLGWSDLKGVLDAIITRCSYCSMAGVLGSSCIVSGLGYPPSRRNPPLLQAGPQPL